MYGVKKELYEKTVKRLARGGINDPTSQIIALAEEIEGYREKIIALEGMVRAGNIPLKEPTELAGCVWFPSLPSDGIISWIEEKLRDGWEPRNWAYEPGTISDYNGVCFILEREERKNHD